MPAPRAVVPEPPGCCSALPCPPALPTLRTTHSPGSGGGSPRGRPASGWGAIEAKSEELTGAQDGLGRGVGGASGQASPPASSHLLCSLCRCPRKGRCGSAPGAAAPGSRPQPFPILEGSGSTLETSPGPCPLPLPAVRLRLRLPGPSRNWRDGWALSASVWEQEPVPSCQPHHAAFHVASRKSSWDTDPRH